MPPSRSRRAECSPHRGPPSAIALRLIRTCSGRRPTSPERTTQRNEVGARWGPPGKPAAAVTSERWVGRRRPEARTEAFREAPDGRGRRAAATRRDQAVLVPRCEGKEELLVG